MTLDDDHHDLKLAWTNLRAELHRLQDRLVWTSDVMHLDISEAANRTQLLYRYADSAIAMAEVHRYEPAFALIRTSLEQMVFDWLLFAGETYRQREDGITPEVWSDWQAAREGQEPWTRAIHDWTRAKNGQVIITFKGPLDKDGQPSPSGANFYYHLLRTYDPTLGKPAYARDTGFVSKATKRQNAKANEINYRLNLSWSALKESLIANGLVSTFDIPLLDSHYSFLSGYVHPISDRTAATYGSSWPPVPRYDHYSSELIYLYAIAIGAAELEHFLHSIRSKRAIVAVDDADAVTQVINESLRAAQHFWFLGTQAHDYDICQAMNGLVMQRMADTHGVAQARQTHGPVEIPYPPDPLKRLIRMHRGTRDLILPHHYTSPWPRADAELR